VGEALPICRLPCQEIIVFEFETLFKNFSNRLSVAAEHAFRRTTKVIATFWTT